MSLNILCVAHKKTQRFLSFSNVFIFMRRSFSSDGLSVWLLLLDRLERKDYNLPNFCHNFSHKSYYCRLKINSKFHHRVLIIFIAKIRKGKFAVFRHFSSPQTTFDIDHFFLNGFSDRVFFTRVFSFNDSKRKSRDLLTFCSFNTFNFFL